jgi:hypothetical protein
MYQFLTQLTLIIHLLFILFVVLGGFIAGRRWVKFIHIACVVWALYAELSPGVLCPLTTLENYFAYRAGIATYEEDFVSRYLVPVIYQENLTREIQFILAGVVVLTNVIAYTYQLKWKKIRSKVKN